MSIFCEFSNCSLIKTPVYKFTNILPNLIQGLPTSSFWLLAGKCKGTRLYFFLLWRIPCSSSGSCPDISVFVPEVGSTRSGVDIRTTGGWRGGRGCSGKWGGWEDPLVYWSAGTGTSTIQGGCRCFSRARCAENKRMTTLTAFHSTTTNHARSEVNNQMFFIPNILGVCIPSNIPIYPYKLDKLALCTRWWSFFKNR